MRFVENVSWRKVGTRWVVAAILGAGLLLHRMTVAIFFASLMYFVVEGDRIRTLSYRRETPVTELVSSSGWFLRRGFLWVLILLATAYNLLIAADLLVALFSGSLLYIAGLFAQSAQKHEQSAEGGERGQMGENRQASRRRLGNE